MDDANSSHNSFPNASPPPPTSACDTIAVVYPRKKFGQPQVRGQRVSLSKEDIEKLFHLRQVEAAELLVRYKRNFSLPPSAQILAEQLTRALFITGPVAHGAQDGLSESRDPALAILKGQTVGGTRPGELERRKAPGGHRHEERGAAGGGNSSIGRWTRKCFWASARSWS